MMDESMVKAMTDVRVPEIMARYLRVAAANRKPGAPFTTMLFAVPLGKAYLKPRGVGNVLRLVIVHEDGSSQRRRGWALTQAGYEWALANPGSTVIKVR